MAKIKDFIRQEIVLCIAFLAAAISMIFVPPDMQYKNYFDLRTLALLYCLMIVVAGMRKAGTFARLAHILCTHAGNTRSLGVILVALSFFSAMFITNHVALITFVPFAVVVLGMAHQEKQLIMLVVLQTAAANLGSILTPVGNPQNIYIQSFYNLSSADFLRTTFPVWLISLVLLLLLCLLLPGDALSLFLGESPILHGKKLCIYLGLFVICLITVLRILSWWIMLIIVTAVLAVYDIKSLKDADFFLLLTFVFFFIFSGNLARMDSVDRFLRAILTGHEYGMGLLLSQIISNVPATLLLSGFTDNAKALLLGVDVGGLGTPIASLASLISLKLYSHSENANLGKYLIIFTIINILMLALLSIPALILLHT